MFMLLMYMQTNFLFLQKVREDYVEMQIIHIVFELVS